MYNIKLYNTKIVRVYFSTTSKISLFLDRLNLKAGKNHGEQGNPGKSCDRLGRIAINYCETENWITEYDLSLSIYI